MKQILLILSISFLSFSSFSQNCFLKLQKAFDDRGSYTIADDMHKDVILSFFREGGVSECVSGKARVENGLIVSIFLQYEDNTYELMEKKFYNSKKLSPTIVNGITEMIYTSDAEKFKIIFINHLKPKGKALKTVSIPDDF